MAHPAPRPMLQRPHVLNTTILFHSFSETKSKTKVSHFGLKPNKKSNLNSVYAL